MVPPGAPAAGPRPPQAGSRSDDGGRGTVTATQGGREADGAGIVELRGLVRRVVGARVADPDVADDLVQETLTRVMGAGGRLDPQALAPYAVVTARNLVTSVWQRHDRHERNAHRLLERPAVDGPEETVVRREAAEALAAAMAQLSPQERDGIVAHELEQRSTGSLADEWGSTPGAVAARLNRSRAKLRVEYLIALGRSEPPTPRCRPVLLALSAGERRRQRDLEVGHHLLECDFCAHLSEPLLDRRQEERPGEVRVVVERDAHVVGARQKAREVAAELGFTGTDLTLISTAVSEIARNIVQFAKRGEVLLSAIEENGRRGLLVVAHDAGPGIADVAAAQRDGFSSYGGMGLGLPGCRRLMDDFDITSEVDRGTTVVMTKWL